MPDLETYNGQLEHLDLDYVRESGEEIRARLFPRPTQVFLADGGLGDGPTPTPLPVALSFQPGNGTAYDLVFVPVVTIQQVTFARPVPEGIPEDVSGWTLVARTNQPESNFAYPFDLSFGALHHVSYVREKTSLPFADAAALTALLRAVSGVDVLDAA